MTDMTITRECDARGTPLASCTSLTAQELSPVRRGGYKKGYAAATIRDASRRKRGKTIFAIGRSCGRERPAFCDRRGRRPYLGGGGGEGGRCPERLFPYSPRSSREEGPMEYRQLGGSGFKVPVLSFGTGTFGGGNELFKAWGSSDVEEATRLVDVCLEAG